MKSSPRFSRPSGVLRASKSWLGFSLVEVLVTITVLGIIASVAYVATGNISGVARGEKVRTDVATLNSAIDAYLANGGSLDGLTTADEVLAKLKTQRSAADAKRHVGTSTGRMIDPRVITVTVPGSDSHPRATYDPVNKRFDVTTSGQGVRFDVDANLNEMNIPNETRASSAVLYASNDTWVWDFNNGLTNPKNLPNLTQVPVSKAPADTLPAGAEEEEEEEEEEVVIPPLPALPNPKLTPPGGTYAKSGFPMTVTIENMAPTLGTIQLWTRFGGVDSGWQPASSGQTVAVPQYGEVWVQAIPNDPTVYQASSTYGYYTIPTPPTLPTPILSKAGGFHPSTDFPLSITISNVPDPVAAKAVYQLDAGAWMPYAGSISVAKNQQLRVQFETLNADNYASSAIRTEKYYPMATSLAGSVSGKFQNPAGGPTLKQEIREGGTFFSHGNPTIDLNGEIIDAGEANTLKFDAGTFSGVNSGASFKIGDLFYHNGTTFNDSHATAVELSVRINLSNPNQNIDFTLKLNLVNTENSGDAAESADYVQISNLVQDIALTIDGVNYGLNLEFGGTDSFGFSTSNEFHVYEGATGKGTINGKFVAK
jgi:prepilin-type N-terminal cleavage/methylation domain-containing protein